MKDKTEILQELNRLMEQYDILSPIDPTRSVLLAKINILGWVLNKTIKTYPGGKIER